MPAPLDRETLKSMKRADLQRICKDYGIKANLKTDALIDLLVDTIQGAPRPTPQPPQRAPSTRAASRSTTTSRLRGASSSSVIIHDTDEEDNAHAEDIRTSLPSAHSSEPGVAPDLQPRTRRAKNTQYRLGVGRPTVAGGSGARTVTRTASLAQKGKRGKGSKSAKPMEAAILEEEEPDPMLEDIPQAGPSGTAHEPFPPEPLVMSIPPQPVPLPDPLAQFAVLPIPPADMSEQLRTYITNLVMPLQTQIQLLQTDLQQRPAQVADLDALTAQVCSLRSEVELLRPQAALVPQLRAEVQQLQEMVSFLTQATTGTLGVPSEKSLGKARASDEGSTQTIVGGSEVSHATSVQPPPGMTQSLLGKRHRDLDDSQATDLGEAAQESRRGQEDREQRATKPTRKRPKLSDRDGSQQGSSSQPTKPESDEADDTGNGEGQPAPRPTFTVFQGPEEPPEAYLDPPPPTTHLSDLFPFDAGSGQVTPPNAGGAIPRPPGADENATNHPNFNFDFNPDLFNPITSTPFDMSLPPFTYPEPPVSPSPAAPSGGFVERAGGRIERNDLFVPLRRPTPSQPRPPSRPQSAVARPASRSAASGPSISHLHSGATGAPPAGSGTVDPTALMASPMLPSLTESPPEGPSISSVAMAENSDFLSFLPRRTVSSTEVGIQLGMSSTLPLPPDPPGAQMKRTMYGTELESDTRFGDFGVEGVASGFWAGLTRRL
ncbi:hypothetical protein BD309DRAFT_881731 [Dichomitus squalens]|uniref:uncharacterized protein n=1 Tax=Dichomitus squalens (strain LYAD-421) TaxID=732165 RepID=UPI0004411312|nr:uncharacterized protein DICSQDRAFT_130828 [Dichomitus squalens LYAD-421 SS1]EJF66570.1 hypothetical protein DICSQDRAFT_130828 [Dichomitus squalens LYAD-421 SS1]TBU49659.1 hypothetical protein BD309DRAFT_881731 [Dichomitus squalens]